MRQWYVLRSKPNREELLCKQMETYDIEVYFPQVTKNPVNPRARKSLPFFTGYLFVKLDLQSTGFSFLQWMPYSLGLVTFGAEPTPVSDELIHSVQKQAAVFEMTASTPNTIQYGDHVMIERGPFTGYKAMFDTNLSGTERARVLLSLLQNKQMAIDLPTNFFHLQHA